MWLGNGNPAINERYVSGNFNCFSRDTEFLTDKGIKSFEDFEDGDEVKVLNKNGKWSPAKVTNFEESEIYELTIKKGKQTQVIKTTSNHRWYVKRGSKSSYEVITTNDLKEKDVLRAKKRYEHANIQPSNVGIMHGIVFGDGSYDKKKNHCRVHLIGDKKELRHYFTDGSVSTTGKDNNLVVYGLPNTWKELPSMDMNIEYLYGFLIGLFATDGNNSSNQHTIANKDKKVLKRVKDIASVCGINTGDILKKRDISPFNGEKSPLYSINLSAFDIKEDFLINNKHKANFKRSINSTRTQNKFWKVVSVKATGRTESVWCVQEPETESFTLGNGVLTKNCSFTNIEKWEDLEDVMYLLSVGSGVGYKVTKKMAKNLAPMNPNIKIVNKEYEPKEKEDRLDQDKSILRIKERVAHLEIADTKEGWVDGLRKVLNLFQDTSKPVDEIHVNYDSVRPTGERLKTFGGTASGPEPLAKLYKGIEQSIKNEIDPSLDPLEVHDNGFVQVRPIHVMDISNMIAYTIIAGGVRRSAQIYLFDEDDYESIFAKYAMYGLWDIDQHNEVREKLVRANVEIPSWFDDIVFDKPTPDGKVGERKANLAHRAMSNNSVAFIEKPSDEYLELLFTMMRGEGEPKHIWAL